MKQLSFLFVLLCLLGGASRAATVSGTVSYAGSTGPMIGKKVYLADSSTGVGLTILDSAVTSATGAYSITVPTAYTSGRLLIYTLACGYRSQSSGSTYSGSSLTINLALGCSLGIVNGTVSYAGWTPPAGTKVYLVDSATSGTILHRDSTVTNASGGYSFSVPASITTGMLYTYTKACGTAWFSGFYTYTGLSITGANIYVSCGAVTITDSVVNSTTRLPVAGQKVYLLDSSATIYYRDSAITDVSGRVFFNLSFGLPAATMKVYTYACGLQSQTFSYSGSNMTAPTLAVCLSTTVVSGTLTNATTSTAVPYWPVTLVDSSGGSIIHYDSTTTNSTGGFSFIVPSSITSGRMVVSAFGCGYKVTNGSAYTGSNLTLNLGMCATSTATISGLLINGATSLPVSGQKVYFLDSVSSTLIFRDSAVTNSSGYYSFIVPAATPTAMLQLSTMSCGSMAAQYYYYSGSSITAPNWSVYSGTARSISGTIYFQNGSGAPGINISLYNSGTTATPWAYAITGSSGAYTVTIPCDWSAGNIVFNTYQFGSSCTGISDTISWSGSTTSGLSDTLSYNAAATISGTVYYRNGTKPSTGVVYISNYRISPATAITANISSTGTYSAALPCGWTAGTLAIDAYDYSGCSSPYRFFNWPGGNMTGVKDTVCLYRISGNVSKQGGGAAANARVYAIRSFLDTSVSPNVTTLTAIDSTITNSAGQYQFEFDQNPFAPPGGGFASFYATYVKAALQSTDPAYLNFLPTYRDSALVWSNADTVDQMTWYNRWGGMNISLRAGSNPGGPGFIGGNVLLGANKTAGVGDPLAGRILLLTTAAGKAVAYTYSDASGQFSFSNLALGNYLLFGDAGGKANPPLAISLTAGGTTVNNVVFEESSDKFEGHLNSTGVSNSSLNAVSVFPNPAKDQVSISGLTTIKGDKTIILSNISGQIISTTKIAATKTASFSIKQLPAGMYMLQLRTEEGTANFRLVKE